MPLFVCFITRVDLCNHHCIQGIELFYHHMKLIFQSDIFLDGIPPPPRLLGQIILRRVIAQL